MVAVVVMVVVMVAKVDKGERVVQWKGPLIGVRWHVGGRRAARAAEGGGRGAQDPAEGRELLQERRVKEGGRSRGSEWGGWGGGATATGAGWSDGRADERTGGRTGGRLVGRMTGAVGQAGTGSRQGCGLGAANSSSGSVAGGGRADDQGREWRERRAGASGAIAGSMARVR